MAFNVFDERDHGICFVVAIVFMPITIFATGLRFWLTRLPGRKVSLEDWFALLALITFLVYASITVWILVTMNGKSVFKLSSLPMSTVIAIYKAGYVMNIQTPMNQTFAKLSLLTLYHRVFNIEQRFRYSVYAVGAIQVAWCIAMVAVRLFQCKPIKRAWNPIGKGTCLDPDLMLAAGDAINSSIDFVMIGLAVWMVARLQLSRANKWKLSILFALGGFAGVIGFVKIVLAYGTVGGNITNAIWYNVEQAVSILCCSVPIYKPILKQINIFHSKVFSFMYTFRSRSTQGESKGSVETSRTVGSRGSGPKKEWFQLDGSSQRELINTPSPR